MDPFLSIPGSGLLHYPTLVAYGRLGQADMLLWVESQESQAAASLPVHIGLFRALSTILHDVITSTTLAVDPISGIKILPLQGDCWVDWLQALTAMYMNLAGASDDDMWGAMLKVRQDKDKSAEALYGLADKYNILSVANLARRALLLSTKPQPGEPTTQRGTVEPWQLASTAMQRNDQDLFDRCMSTVCELLENGGSIILPPASLRDSLGPVVNQLVFEVNKAVAGIPAKLVAGESNRIMCGRLAGEVRDLQGKCKLLESSKVVMSKQVKDLKKHVESLKHKQKSVQKP